MKTELADKILDAYRAAKADPENPENANRFDFPWSETVFGSDGRKLYVHERSDRPGAVRVRWGLTDEEQAERAEASRVAPSVATPQAIRSERGDLLKRACARAVDAAKGEYEQWLNPPEAQRESKAPLTLFDGFIYAADPKVGLSVGSEWHRFLFARPDDDDHKVTASVYQIIDRIIGLRETTWAEWTLEHSRIVWRTLAAESEDGKGARLAEQTVGAVYTIADHLRPLRMIGEFDCVPDRGWRRSLKDDWQRITDKEIEVVRHRYAEEETAALVRGFREAEDPRLRTAGVFGIGFRRGQVVRTPRSSLHLDHTGAYGRGRVVIPGRKGKSGGTVDLTPPMRSYFEWLLKDGYLSELEAARESGAISDYYLLPSHRFTAGKALVRHHETHLSKRELGRRFNALEKSVGVSHVQGRSWHALRRSMSDQIADETTDEVVRDMAQGWTPGGGTRAGLYMDKERKKQAVAAAKARNAALRRLASSNGATEALTAEIEAIHQSISTLERIGTHHESLEVAQAVDTARTLLQELETLADSASAIPSATDLSHKTGYEDHESIAARVSQEMDRRGLTGKNAAEMLGVPQSNISAIRRGKSAGIVSTERLTRMLEQLLAEQETG